MNISERKMLDLLKKGRDKLCVCAVKAAFARDHVLQDEHEQRHVRGALTGDRAG